MICSSCERRDFASSLRCQWCGTPLRQGVSPFNAAPVSPVHPPVPANPPMMLSGAPDGDWLDFSSPEPPPISHLTPALVGPSVPAASSALLAPALLAPPLNTSRSDLDEPKKSGFKKLGPLLGPLAVALGKFKVLLGALKFGKLATTFGSMIVSIGFYALLFGWKFAIGFVLLIFVHEMGHVIALKRRGIPIEGMFFIPFLGAAVSFKKRPRDPAIDAEISWAGPFAGLLGGAVCAGFYAMTDNVFWAALAHVTFLLNLINLAPSVPLDGGWIVKAINPKFSLIGSLVGIGVGLYLHSTMLAIIAAMGAFNAYNSVRHADDNFDQISISPQTRGKITAAYLGLIFVLGGAMAYSTHVLHEDRARRDAIKNGDVLSAALPKSIRNIGEKVRGEVR